MDNTLKLVAWVLRGSQKRVIFRLLNNKKIIPAELYQEAVKINPKITRNSVSDVLREFRKKQLVTCLNPEEKKGRLYTLTKLGEKLSKEI